MPSSEVSRPLSMTKASTSDTSARPTVTIPSFTCAALAGPFAVITVYWYCSDDGSRPKLRASSAVRATAVAPVSTRKRTGWPSTSASAQKWPSLDLAMEASPDSIGSDWLASGESVATAARWSSASLLAAVAAKIGESGLQRVNDRPEHDDSGARRTAKAIPLLLNALRP